MCGLEHASSVTLMCVCPIHGTPLTHSRAESTFEQRRGTIASTSRRAQPYLWLGTCNAGSWNGTNTTSQAQFPYVGRDPGASHQTHRISCNSNGFTMRLNVDNT